jgi:hypothetical protein
MDNSVFVNALAKSEENAVSRRFLEVVRDRGDIKLYQPAGFLLELVSTMPRKNKNVDLDWDYARRLGLTREENAITMKYVEVTIADILEFISLVPEGMTSEDWRSRFLAVRPAYDLEYAIVARKCGGVLVTLDLPMLNLDGGVTTKHPADLA